MSEKMDITLPKLGESIVSATVVNWLKKVGDPIALDEPFLEVSTDKVNSEIPSPVAGVITEILALENEEIEVGAILARVDTHGPIALESSKASSPALQKPAIFSCAAVAKGANAELFSPAVLRLAQVEGISLELLRQIEGTGKEGRISKKDVEEFIKNRKGNGIAQPTHIAPPQEEKKCPLAHSLEERVELTGMRKAIADNMVRSFYEAPHASLVQEVDVTDILAYIAKEKEAYQKTHGIKLTITSFIVYALSRALQNFPLINASLEDKTIVMKRYVNVGIAVNIPGGLIVPVIRHCHERNLTGIARGVAEIATKAREGKLSPDEVQGGTITLSNFGMAGALIGVPIIRYPEVAIIGAGTIQKRVVVREDDSLAIRKMLYLTLTFDHRVIDGIYGCDFMKNLKDHLESFPFEGLR